MATGGALTNCQDLMGSKACASYLYGTKYLANRSTQQMLKLVGASIESVDLGDRDMDKRFFPKSFGGSGPCDDDILTGRGMFYITQQGRLMLDCTAGHYQMTWGYNHPDLVAVVREGMELGVVWDSHLNLPGLPVKLLSEKLISLCEGTGLDRVLLGVCTGSVACAAALKIMLERYRRHADHARAGAPVIISLRGNYHGTDIGAQTLRGMWPGLLAGMEAVQVEPNDTHELTSVFERFGKRVAGFWAEPILMNREAIAVESSYLKRARELCTQSDALLAIDEIQTGFWSPEVLSFTRLDFAPDLVVVGKGMTAGFHPLSALIFREDLDILEQYDAISTNGNASLAALVALGNLRLIERHAQGIAAVSQRHWRGLGELARDFPALIDTINGAGLLTGIRFKQRECALAFNKAALDRGLWMRVHAYHEDHRTVLTKYALTVEDSTVEFVLGIMRELLADMAG